jgi:predicted GNAT family acetyltransferase
VDIEFVDTPERHRYELRSADELIGIVAYHLDGDVITLVHTEVGSAHSGHGYAAILARGALDDARSRGLRVVPSCPYIASYLEKHPEDADLVA